MRSSMADLMASFAVPMLAQIPSSPLHILSMDLYLRKGEDGREGGRMGEREGGFSCHFLRVAFLFFLPPSPHFPGVPVTEASRCRIGCKQL